jgi:hypothetical protein
MYKLSKIVDTGDFHIPVKIDQPAIVDLYQNNIPKVFKIDLRGLESPVELHFNYLTYKKNLNRKSTLSLGEVARNLEVEKTNNSFAFCSFKNKEPS